MKLAKKYQILGTVRGTFDQLNESHSPHLDMKGAICESKELADMIFGSPMRQTSDAMI